MIIRKDSYCSTCGKVEVFHRKEGDNWECRRCGEKQEIKDTPPINWVNSRGEIISGTRRAPRGYIF